MKSKQGLRILNICMAILLVLGSVMVDITPVSAAAATGTASATATPTYGTPPNGGQVTVAISIDVTSVNSPDHKLGAFNGTLDWDPAKLSYVSNGGLLAGFTGAINTANVATGHIAFNGANVSGVTGNNIVLNITFDMISPGGVTLDLAFSSMASATTFADIMPILTVTDGSVTVPNIIYVGSLGSGTQNVAATLTTVISLSISTSIRAGDAIIIAYTTDAAPDIPLSITNSWSTGDKYQIANHSIMSAQIRTYIFAAYSVGGLTAGSGNTITIAESLPTSGTQPQNRAAVAAVFRGLAPVGALEQSSNGPANNTATTGTTPNSGAITTVQQVQLVIGAVGTKGDDSAAPGTWSAGWTAGPVGGTTGVAQTVSMAYQIVSSPGSFTASKTIPTARYWGAVVASFKTNITNTIAYLGEIGSTTNQSKSAGTSLPIQTNAAVAVGDDIIVAFSADASTNVPTISDTSGNTYNMIVDVTSAAHVRTTIFQTHITTALPAGNPAITISHDNLTARSAVVSVFRGLASSPSVDQTKTAFSTTAGTIPSSGASSSTTQADELLIGAVGTELGHYAAPGTWSNSFSLGPRLGTGVGTTTSSATDINTSMGWKIVSATSAYTAQKQGIGSSAWTASLATFKMATGGPTHTLTANVTPSSSYGSITGVSNPYAEGAIANIMAVANPGYIFDQWTAGDCTGSTNPACSVTMSTDKSVTANFLVAHNLTVAVSPSAGGTTTPAVGVHPYAEGSSVPVTASVNPGYSFVNWSDACTGTDPNVCSVLMNADHTVTANFTINQYALNLAFGGSGGGRVTSSPSGLDCTSSCSHSFDYNTAVVLTAAAAVGSQFTGWSGESCSGTGTCSVTMTAIRNVTASFTIIPTYNLTMAVDPGGSGTTDPAIGIHTYNGGDVVIIAATAATGYVFDHWTGDVANVNAATTTVTMGADKTVTAHFTVSPIGYIGDAGPSVYADASGTTMAITVGSTGVATGNTIIIGFASRGVSNYTVPTISDSKGNTYTSATCSVAYTHGRIYIFYAPVTTALVSGDLITLTSSPAVTNRVMVASVFSGLLAVSPLDQVQYSTVCTSTTAATASNDATSGPTATTTQADELVIGVIGAEDSGGTTPVDAGLGTWLNSFMAGQTQKSQNTNSYRWRVSLGRYLATATGQFTAAQTYTNTPYWAAAVATFKAAPINHTVTFNSNGGTGSMSNQVANVPTALTLNAFTRSGYTFAGWNTQSGGGGTAYADGATYAFAADTTLYAQWSALANHTVTFNANGGTGSMSNQITNVPTALTLNAFTRSGYTFAGWNTQSGGGGTAYADGATYAFAADTTLYAQWSALANHTVTFNSNGGTGSMSNQVANVPTALTLNAFTRAGYTFSGWNTLANGTGTAYANGATYAFAADTTLYAQWSALANHTVTFNSNGGTGSMSNQVANVPTALTLNAFTRSGYTFAGWNTQSGGGGTAYADGATYAFAADTTLYAQWTAQPTIVVTSAATPSDGTPDVGDTITVNININISGAALGSYTGTLDWNPAILAYQSYSGAPPTGFTGAVNTTDTGTGHIIFNGASTAGATGNTIVLTITFNVVGSGTSALDLGYSAMAAASTFANLLPYLTVTDGQVIVAALPNHTVTFNSNGGTGSMSNQVANVPTALTLNAFTRSGYTFAGWNTQSGGGGTAYTDGATYAFAADTTLYAQWSALANHTVTFNSNGGTGSMSNQVANVPTALTLNAFTRSGYTFAGWNTQSGGGGTAYTDGATYAFAADTTLYAQWSALANHTVTFNSNGGTGSMSNQVANVPTALTANAFTRAGYSFSGWNTLANGTGTAYANGATYAFAADITLYAQWSALANHTVTFNSNGGTGSMSNQVANVPTALTLNAFTRSGYSFNGWNTQADGLGTNYANGATYTFAADITLYAQWSALANHTVTFNSNGGTGSMSNQVANVPTALTLNAFTRSGYTFAGWNTQSGGGGTAYADGATYAFAADTTLYAQWTAQPTIVVTSAATPSDGTPDVGDTITVNININISGAALGSYTGTLDWNPAILAYQSYSGAPPTGFTGAVNTTDTGTGHIIFNGASTAGATGNTIVLTITFNVVGSGTSALDLGYSAMAAASTFANLLPYLTVTDGQVIVAALPNHTVTFNSNGGTGSMSNQVANVPTALTLNAFTRSGYSFNGWNTQADGLGTNYADGATYSFAADITLYAQWTALPNHTVTFNSNSGTGSMSPQIANVPTALTANAFTRAGYSFSGWNTAANGSGTAYANGATYSFAADITLYAQWTALPNHTVTFNSNGGTGSMSPQIANVPTALTANAFTRSGYNFAGWNTLANGTGNAYANGATYSFAADITLYAQWTAQPTIIVTSAATPSDGTPDIGDTITVGININISGAALGSYTGTLDWNPAILAYQSYSGAPPTGFTGAVNTTNTGTGHIIFNGASSGGATGNTIVLTITFNVVGSGTSALDLGYSAMSAASTFADLLPDLTVTDGQVIVAALPNHTVTFNANGGTGSMSPQVANVPTALTANAFTRVGYSFSGWNTAANGSGTAYANGATYSFAADITLYAQWTALANHTVTFNSNSGTGSMSPQIANVATALTANAFTRSGYNFAGWNTAANGSGTAYANGATYAFDADITLYAQWSALANHTVTFNSNGGSGTMAPQIAPVPTALTLNAFTWAGYSFSSWNTLANGTGTAYANGATYPFTVDITLYAQWSENTVTHSIPLYVGWNLVSFKVHPTNTAITTVMGSISGNYDLVYAWDASGAHSGSGNWMRYAPGIPGNTLATLDETQGFWIRMTTAATLDIVGTAPLTTNINLLTTASGWNLVGYPSAVNRSLPSALADHGVTAYTLVYGYHANDADTWKRYAPGVPGNDLLELAPGWGYWIKVTSPNTWDVEY